MSVWGVTPGKPSFHPTWAYPPIKWGVAARFPCKAQHESLPVGGLGPAFSWGARAWAACPQVSPNFGLPLALS